MGYGMMGGFGMGAMGAWGLVWMLAALTLLAALTVWLIRAARRPQAPADRTRPAAGDPVQALKMRYAEGKIDGEEYQQRLSALTSR